MMKVEIGQTPGMSVATVNGVATVAERGSFMHTVSLTRLLVYCGSTQASATVKPVVWSDTGTKIAEGTASTFTNTVNGGLYGLSFPTPVTLNANTIYRVGVHQSVNFARIESQAVSHTHDTYPAYTTWTEADTSFYIAMSDSWPNTASPYEMHMVMEVSPSITVANPMAGSGDTLKANDYSRFTWISLGPTQTSYELLYRVKGTSTWTTVTGGSDEWHEFAPNTFSSGQVIEWRVRPSSNGVVGAYSPIVEATFDNWEYGYVTTSSSNSTSETLATRNPLVTNRMPPTFEWNKYENGGTITQYSDGRLRLQNGAYAEGWADVNGYSGRFGVEFQCSGLMPASTTDAGLLVRWELYDSTKTKLVRNDSGRTTGQTSYAVQPDTLYDLSANFANADAKYLRVVIYSSGTNSSPDVTFSETFARTDGGTTYTPYYVVSEGNYDIQVRTADLGGFGPWSASASAIVSSYLDVYGEESISVAASETSASSGASKDGSDGASVHINDDAPVVTKNFSSSDSLRVSTSESSVKYSNMPGGDGAGLRTTEAQTIVISSSASDTSGLRSTESYSTTQLVIKSATDSRSLMVSESHNLNVSLQAKSSADTLRNTLTETSNRTASIGVPGEEPIRLGAGEDSLVVQAVLSAKIPTVAAVAMNDRPDGWWMLDTAAPFSNRSSFPQTGTYVGAPGTHAAVAAGAEYARVFSSGNTASFTTRAFKRGQELKDFTLEASIFPVTIGTTEQAILSHQLTVGAATVYDGLTINGTVVSFSTRHEAGAAVASYDLETRRGATIAGVHTASKNSLYVDGELVAEVDIPDELRDSPYLSNDGLLYAGSASGTQAVAMNAVGIYNTALTRTRLQVHSTASKLAVPTPAVPVVMGGTPLTMDYIQTNFYERKITGGELKKSGMTNTVFARGVIRPTYDGGLSLAGTWEALIPIEHPAYTTVHAVSLTWEGEGITMEVSPDGATWTPITNGARVPFISPGSASENLYVFVRAAFPGGRSDDASYLGSVNARIQAGSAVLTMANRSVALTGPSFTREQFHVFDYDAGSGLMLDSGATLTISPDTTNDPTVRTIEAWIMRTGATAPTITPPGPTFINGKSGTFSLDIGEWTLVHIVSTTNITSNIVISGPAVVGQVSLYADPLTADQINSVYAEYTSIPSTSVADAESIGITQPDDAISIYSHDWTVAST